MYSQNRVDTQPKIWVGWSHQLTLLYTINLFFIPTLRTFLASDCVKMQRSGPVQINDATTPPKHNSNTTLESGL